MSEALMIHHCSPVLAGMKCGGLFTYEYADKEAVVRDVGAVNRRLVPRGLRMIPLRFLSGRALIYLYRPKKRKEFFSHEQAAKMLCEYGYTPVHPALCVVQLCRRFTMQTDFPHEIGLFLGYPPEDVHGFIKNKAACAKYVGCWKVYGDEERAKKIFARYRKCTAVYAKQWQAGISIERLTVAD